MKRGAGEAHVNAVVCHSSVVCKCHPPFAMHIQPPAAGTPGSQTPVGWENSQKLLRERKRKSRSTDTFLLKRCYRLVCGGYKCVFSIFYFFIFLKKRSRYPPYSTLHLIPLTLILCKLDSCYQSSVCRYSLHQVNDINLLAWIPHRLFLEATG